jgi:hypothetical protein
MSDVFSLNGSYQTVPTSGNLSGLPEVSALLSERVSLQNKVLGHYELLADAPQVVALGGLTNVNVLVIKASGGKVKVTVSSADGATQVLPVDPLLILIDRTVPITAISLTRVASTDTTVDLFLGELAD